MPKEIRVAHSPDSDDAFMFYALARQKVDTGELRYVHVLSDIETLNRKALEGEYEVSAISFHAYAYLADRYALLSSGASMGKNYGPIVVAREPLAARELAQKTIAIPGTLTTAFLALRLFESEGTGPNFGPVPTDIRFEVVPFDQILDRVREGRFEAGLLIHEGQLTYGERGLHKVLDLGEWWLDRTGLPLPLGGNIIRRDLGPELMRTVSGHMRESIRYGLEHRSEALAYALQFARGMDPEKAGRFVGMYVNEITLDYGVDGKKAVQRLLLEAHQKGLIPKPVAVEFV